MGLHELYTQVRQSDVSGLGAALAGKAASGHTHPGPDLSGYVPTSQRGPIGGVAASSGSGSWTPNAATASEHQRTMTGATTVAGISGGVSGQPVFLWFFASGATRTVTFASGFETTQAVPGRVFTIPSGTWGSVLVKMRGTTPVLMAAYPQQVDVSVTFSSMRRYRNGNQSLAANAGAVVALNGTDFTQGTGISASGNGIAVTAADLYLVTWEMFLAGGSTGARSSYLQLNGATVRDGPGLGNEVGPRLSGSATLQLPANGVLTLCCYVSGTTAPVVGGTVPSDTGLTVTRLGS